MKIVHVRNYEKRKKSLARALSAFAEYIGIDKVKLVVTSRGLMVRPFTPKKKKDAHL